jgi:hypothetical protein
VPCRVWRVLLTFGSNEILNFIVILRDEKVTTTKEGRRHLPLSCFDMADGAPDWLASVDKSEVLEKLSNFHPGLLAVIK